MRPKTRTLSPTRASWSPATETSSAAQRARNSGTRSACPRPAPRPLPPVMRTCPSPRAVEVDHVPEPWTCAHRRHPCALGQREIQTCPRTVERRRRTAPRTRGVGGPTACNRLRHLTVRGTLGRESARYERPVPARPQRRPQCRGVPVLLGRVDGPRGVGEVEGSAMLDAPKTCRCRCGTSKPATIRPTRGGAHTALIATPTACATVVRWAISAWRRVGPLVDLEPRHDEGVARTDRVDREERDRVLVGPDEPRGQLAGDDAGEDGGHGRRT